MNNRNRNIIFAIISLGIISGAFISGMYFGFNRKTGVAQTLINKDQQNIFSEKVDFSHFWKTWDLISEKYPNSEVTDQEKVFGAISGLVGSLDDPYSVFMPPEESKAFEETIIGEFGGVGMEVGQRDDILTVIAPLKNTPAYNAGIKTGDKIIKIDDTVTANMSIDGAISLIRGEKGTEVRLTILREGEGDPKEVTLIRDIISIPTLETETTSDNIFIIRLYSFSLHSPKLFQNALRDFEKTGSDKMIIDLRGNPGGYLDAAIDMTSWFLPIGKTILIEDFGEKKEEKIYRSKGYDIFRNKNIKIVILVDGGSASASEIFAGALQEYGLALLVGEKTYGKGSVQELVEITADTSLKITVANWLTPNGVSLSSNGLEPDFKVSLINENEDTQFEKALEILRDQTQ